MDQYLIEVVDADGKPVGEGELGQVLITDLQNWTMPLLRYRIGDLARVHRSKCQCGRSTMRLVMEGRIEDSIKSADGQIITTETIANFMFERFGIDQFELIEDVDNRFQLRFVAPENQSIDESSLRIQLVEGLNLCSSLRVRSTTLIRPSASGKYRHCQSLSNGP
jgi:phenylacetate-CoA ligase